MSEIKVNKISPRTNCGTVQLGDSGDTITIPSGATISNSGTASGFGSTGEVSWNTTKITADPGNAVSGVGYFTDTSGGAFNVTLPSSPSAGNVVAVADYANTWDTNNLTIARNGSNIEGSASNFVCNKEGATITFVYVDATKGWICTNSGNSSQAFTEAFICATGGCTSICGDYKIHTFTGPGTFSVASLAQCSANNIVDYVVVAGGGGGGAGFSSGAGGGGGGGFRYYANTTTNPQACGPALPINNFPSGTSITVTATGFPIAVGGGGAAAPTSPSSVATSGVASTFSTITSAGGGGGGSEGSGYQGAAGGSGGGGGYHSGTGGSGAGNTPPVSPPQGNAGGNFGGPSPGDRMGGGGGGGIQGGYNGAPGAPAPLRGNGGAGGGVKGFGTSGESCGSHYYFSGGGGGQSQFNPRGNPGNPASVAQGGLGGGGNGACTCSPVSALQIAGAGTANTGGGAGGYVGPNGSQSPAANGGSGIVMIRYKFQ
jgi:hypothetical protein